MFDSIFNLIIVLIPLSIFIGRMVVQARSRRHPPPKPAQPHIPVHFEDDEDDPAYFKNVARSSAKSSPAGKASVRKVQKALSPREEAEFSKAVSGAKLPAVSLAKTETQGQKPFPLNLSSLPPLKQAVVMAEILGPPKGMV